MTRVALATFDREREKLPERGVALVTREDDAVVAALAAEGVAAEAVPWTDPSVRWGAYDLVVPKTAWGYDRDLPAFLAWTDRVAAATRLANPPAIVRWNADKRYLLDLAARGVPLAPTILARRGEPLDLARLMDERGWREVVVKRVVAAGARGQARVARGQASTTGQAHLDGILAEGDAFVQPYLAAIETTGERSLVVLAGETSHAVAKLPTAGSYLAHPSHGARTVAHEPTRAEVDVARRALAAAGGPILYARVDLVDLDDGTPAVMELELIEPYLFLLESPGAVARYARAVADAARSV